MPKASSKVKSNTLPTTTEPVSSATEPVVQEKKQRKPKAQAVSATSQETAVKVEPTDEQTEKPAPKKRVSKKAVPVAEVATSSVVVEGELPETSEAEAPITEQYSDFLAKLQQVSTLLSTLKADFKLIEKKNSRELKVAHKQSSKRKQKNGNRAPSGFVKPTLISDELAIFLGKELGSEMARTAVTRDINKYIKEQKLQDKDNGRKIIPDSALAKLLNLKPEDSLTYFNLQKYMSPHFAKKDQTQPTPVVV